MGIIVNKDDDKNANLTDRINADLRMKAQMISKTEDPDLVNDSEYVSNFKKTSKFGWVWAVLIILAIISIIFIVCF